MTKWIISETLRDPQDPDWEKLAVSFFPDGVHPQRKKGFLLSRSSLRDCLGLLKVNCPILSLHLLNHTLLKEWPQYTISLSHTINCGAALIAERKFFRSVGIDVEHEERIVNQSFIERISHSSDLNLRNIELWCLKEAVFKSLMNTGVFEKPVDFSTICIETNSWTHSPSNISGKWELDNLKPFVVARSFLES